MRERGNDKTFTTNGLNEQLRELHIIDPDNKDTKIMAINQIREYFFNIMFPWPSWCKKLGWILLILWTFTAFMMAIMYGLQFDLEVTNDGYDPNHPNYEMYKNEKC